MVKQKYPCYPPSPDIPRPTTPFLIRYSPFAIRHSPLKIFDFSFALDKCAIYDTLSIIS